MGWTLFFVLCVSIFLWAFFGIMTADMSDRVNSRSEFIAMVLVWPFYIMRVVAVYIWEVLSHFRLNGTALPIAKSIVLGKDKWK